MTTKRKAPLPISMSLLINHNSSRDSDRLTLIESIRAGLPFKAVTDAIKDLELTTKDLTEFGVIAARTLFHSRKSGRFTPAQSDRVTRFLRVWQKARETFGNPEKAEKWMRRPTRPLGSKAPVALLDTEEGARLVEDLLLRIDHGLPG